MAAALARDKVASWQTFPIVRSAAMYPCGLTVQNIGDVESVKFVKEKILGRMMRINTVFKVGEIVRLTILDKQAESGQWFETTVIGTSSQSGILLNLEGFVVEFSGDGGEDFGEVRTIDRGCRFDPGSQRFCFYSKLDSEDDVDRRWDEFKASLELSVWNRFDELAPTNIHPNN